tara:strand:- start:1328 stop:2296 length:969 start_codon:yes stop_codon:yes gene_type:complete
MIPVNIVTGFLGSGKTTLIRHLITKYRDSERWGILINEFGEIGIDKAILNNDEIEIKEIPGGCICCVTAPLFQVGFNNLIRKQSPSRIIIEPSGLGHPDKIIEMLRSTDYKDIIKMEATICTIDARQLTSKRHFSNKNFRDQINLADILVATKEDRYSAKNKKNFQNFSDSLDPPKAYCLTISHGKLNYKYLSTKNEDRNSFFSKSHSASVRKNKSYFTDMGWKIIKSSQDAFEVLSWEIEENFLFDKIRLIKWLDKLEIERIKGVFNCENESFSYNRIKDEKEVTIIKKTNTRLQLIDSQLSNIDFFNDGLKKQLNKYNKP